MSKESALQKYTDAIEERNEHLAQNKGVFDSHERIVMKIIDAENELKDAVAEDGKGVENGLYKVTITPQTQKVYDDEVLCKLLQPDEVDKVVKEVTRSPKISITTLKG